MSSRQRVVVSFAEKVGIMDVNHMSETAQRLEARHSLIFYKKQPHDNVIRLSTEGNVELIESSDPSKEIKKINERFSKDRYDVIVKILEDMRASIMDAM